MTPPILPRGGATYNHQRDGARLAAQHVRVLGAMSDGGWHTLRELSDITGDPQASVSARLRDLRKPQFGAYTVDRCYLQRGLWAYRLVLEKSQ